MKDASLYYPVFFVKKYHRQNTIHPRAWYARKKRLLSAPGKVWRIQLVEKPAWQS